MKFSVATVLAATLGLIELASAYPITHATSLHCRSSPSASATLVKTYSAKNDIKIRCQTQGQSVEGSTVWDKTQDGCYVADYYVNTGASGYVTASCSSGGGGGGGGSGGSIPGPMVDDYVYKGQCGGIDPWNYYKCQCVSFVAQRINQRLGISFASGYKGCDFGNANTWYGAAKSCGVTANNTPVPGSIAQYSGGQYGHVAWVHSVSGSQVTIEEYNGMIPEGYSTRTVPASNFNYIHFRV